MQLDSDTDIKDDLGGAMSVKFNPGSTFQDYCAKHISGYDPERLEVLSVRFYHGKETEVTVYAMDKDRLDSAPEGEVPVRKFKLQGSFLQYIIPLIAECNFTLTTGHFPLQSMRVINK